MISATLAIGVLLLWPVLVLAEPQGDVVETIEWESAVGDVSFPHRLHVEDLEIACADCHHETNAARLDIPHPEYLEDFWIDCESCHRPSIGAATPQACSSCHHDSPVTIADETLSSKVVIHRSCWECHEITRGADASRGCGSCHQKPSN